MDDQIFSKYRNLYGYRGSRKERRLLYYDPPIPWRKKWKKENHPVEYEEYLNRVRVRNKKYKKVKTLQEYLNNVRVRNKKVRNEELKRFNLEYAKYEKKVKFLRIKLDELLKVTKEKYVNKEKDLFKEWKKVQFAKETHLNRLIKLKKQEKYFIDQLKKSGFKKSKNIEDKLDRLNLEFLKKKKGLSVEYKKWKLELVKELKIFKNLNKKFNDLNFELGQLNSKKVKSVKKEKFLRIKLDELILKMKEIKKAKNRQFSLFYFLNELNNLKEKEKYLNFKFENLGNKLFNVKNLMDLENQIKKLKNKGNVLKNLKKEEFFKFEKLLKNLNKKNLKNFNNQ